MKAFISPRFLCFLLIVAALAVRAQDHADPAAEKAAKEKAEKDAAAKPSGEKK